MVWETSYVLTINVSLQAKEVIVKFEEKFQYLAVDLKFLEKIQGILTSTQVQIKTEVFTIYSYLCTLY